MCELGCEIELFLYVVVRAKVVSTLKVPYFNKAGEILKLNQTVPLIFCEGET